MRAKNFRFVTIWAAAVLLAQSGHAQQPDQAGAAPVTDQRAEGFSVGLGGAKVIGRATEVNDGVGYRLYEQVGPDGARPPLVFYIGGSEGGFPTYEADVPASLLRAGFSVATIGYFKFDGGPPELSEIDLNAVMNQVAAVSRRYDDAQGCVGVVAVSKGAELSLLMAAHADTVDAYVAAVPSNVVWQASNVTLKTRSSWILNGKPVAFLRYPWLSRAALNIFMGGSDFRALHDAALKNKRAVAKTLIPVDAIDEPVLLMSARQDHVWPSYEMSLDIMNRLDASGAGHRFEHADYDLNHYLFDHGDVIGDAIDYLAAQFQSGEVCGAPGG